MRRVWLTQFVRRVLEAQRSGQRVVCPDVRTHDEMAAIGSLNGHVWRVIRPGAGAPGNAGQHETETDLVGLPDGRFDAVVRNDGGLRDLDVRCADLVARPGPAATPGCYIYGQFR